MPGTRSKEGPAIAKAGIDMQLYLVVLGVAKIKKLDPSLAMLGF